MSSLGADYAHILGRDLASLVAQVGRYPDDASLWRVSGTIKNPAGTLVLHLVGNLFHYVGGALGGSGYVRDRDAEFAERGLSRDDLLGRIHACHEQVVTVLGGVSDDVMAAPYPGVLPPSMAGATTHRFLLHLSGHFMWHLGQVDYHRRIVVERAQP